MIKIGLLDFGQRSNSISSIGKVIDVMEYADEADELGFSRFWLAEHHNYSNSEAWSNPLVLLPLLLNNTERINVGISGILINYYSSYETVMHFKLLANLFPNRVDLGLANGTPPQNIVNLLTDRKDDLTIQNTVPRKVKEIFDFFHNEQFIAENEKIVIPPFKGNIPEVYLLGSTFNFLNVSLDYKFNFSKSIFHDRKSFVSQKDEVLKFKDDFFEKYGIIPKINVAFTGVCASKEREAKKIVKENPFDLINPIVGTKEIFIDKLNSMKEFFGVDEFIFHNASLVNEQKIESINLLSEAFNLKNNYEI